MKLEEALSTLKKAGFAIILNEAAYTKDGEEIDIKDYENIESELNDKISELNIPGVTVNVEGVGEVVFTCYAIFVAFFYSILKSAIDFKTDNSFKIEKNGNNVRIKYIDNENDAANIAKMTLSLISEFATVYKEFFNTAKTALNDAINKLK